MRVFNWCGRLSRGEPGLRHCSSMVRLTRLSSSCTWVGARTSSPWMLVRGCIRCRWHLRTEAEIRHSQVRGQGSVQLSALREWTSDLNFGPDLGLCVDSERTVLKSNTTHLPVGLSFCHTRAGIKHSCRKIRLWWLRGNRPWSCPGSCPLCGPKPPRSKRKFCLCLPVPVILLSLFLCWRIRYRTLRFSQPT